MLGGTTRSHDSRDSSWSVEPARSGGLGTHHIHLRPRRPRAVAGSLVVVIGSHAVLAGVLVSHAGGLLHLLLPVQCVRHSTPRTEDERLGDAPVGLASIHRLITAVSHCRHVRATSRILLVHDVSRESSA